MSSLRLSLCVTAFVAHAVASTASATVTIDWVTVGAPGNACDVQPQGCFGTVADTYRIGKTEVTNAQYAEFLNAKAASDPLGLYSTGMASFFGGITRSGSPGSYNYSAVAEREDKPVVYVSFYDTLRFANWLHNGQGGGDTETGAYALLGGTAEPSNWDTVTRNASATIFLTNVDEWYKAAFYDAVSTSYNPYPFADGFNGAACEVPPGTTTHSANCFKAVENLTDGGAYTTSPSANGTFDQGGNVMEWNEDLFTSDSRVLRGGDWENFPSALAATTLMIGGGPSNEGNFVGFRVAMIPEPGTGLLVMAGLLGLAGWRRHRV
jgi:formylglycine-generating enzyme required for sulfatase activity